MQAADTLGVPYGGPVGSSMLWIADAALCPLLPLGWHEWTLDDQGDATSYGEVSYYQNVLTGQTTWEHPQVKLLTQSAHSLNVAVFKPHLLFSW